MATPVPWRPYHIIREQKWWSLLTGSEGRRQEALLTQRAHDITPGETLLICLTLKEAGVPERLFSYWKSYLAFAAYQRKHWPSGHRYFYEVIPGHIPQKPHFDLEQKLEVGVEPPKVCLDDVWVSLIQRISAVMQEKGITLIPERDILSFSSHGPTKRSYHVVIDNYCHADSKEAKAFYETVL